MSPTHNHLDQWLADEQAALERMKKGPGPGVTRLEQVAALSGLELMQAMLNGEVPFAPIAQTLDFLLIAVGKGRAVPDRNCSTPWAPCTAAGSPPCSTPRWAAPCTP